MKGIIQIRVFSPNKIIERTRDHAFLLFWEPQARAAHDWR